MGGRLSQRVVLLRRKRGEYNSAFGVRSYLETAFYTPTKVILANVYAGASVKMAECKLAPRQKSKGLAYATA